MHTNTRMHAHVHTYIHTHTHTSIHTYTQVHVAEAKQMVAGCAHAYTHSHGYMYMLRCLRALFACRKSIIKYVRNVVFQTNAVHNASMDIYFTLVDAYMHRWTTWVLLTYTQKGVVCMRAFRQAHAYTCITHTCKHTVVVFIRTKSLYMAKQAQSSVAFEFASFNTHTHTHTACCKTGTCTQKKHVWKCARFAFEASANRCTHTYMEALKVAKKLFFWHR